MTYKTISLLVIGVLVLAAAGYYAYSAAAPSDTAANNQTATSTPTGAQGKLDINVVCEGALAYMTFPDAQAAATFVAECKEGKHPEVIEQYRADMGLGEGAAI